MLSKAKEPLQYASGYTLDLYCDHFDGPASPSVDSPDGRHTWNEFPHTFGGETFGECLRQAMDRGWIIRRATRTATCPKCKTARTCPCCAGECRKGSGNVGRRHATH